jgi:hypothetical protein
MRRYITTIGHERTTLKKLEQDIHIPPNPFRLCLRDESNGIIALHTDLEPKGRFSYQTILKETYLWRLILTNIVNRINSRLLQVGKISKETTNVPSSKDL